MKGVECLSSLISKANKHKIKIFAVRNFESTYYNMQA